MGSLGLELPKIDLSGFDVTSVEENTWANAQSAIAQALETYGGFEVVYMEVSPELRNELLGVVVPELFTTPTASTFHDSKQLPYHGPLFKKPGFPFLALQLNDPNALSSIQEHVKILWPQGNDFFCNITLSYAKHMQVLIQIIHMMILRSMGLEDYYDSHIKSLAYSIRFAHYYKEISCKRDIVALPTHKDPNYISIICQHNVEGLEVEHSCDEWIVTKPLTTSFTVLVGEAFQAWTNGRLHAQNHRVKLKNETEKRYVAVFSTIPSLANDTIQTPKELIDEQHPSLFKPFKYYDYIKYRFTEGEKGDDALKAYCGV